MFPPRQRVCALTADRHLGPPPGRTFSYIFVYKSCRCAYGGAEWRPTSAQSRPEAATWTPPTLHFGRSQGPLWERKFAVVAPCENISFCYVLITFSSLGGSGFAPKTGSSTALRPWSDCVQTFCGSWCAPVPPKRAQGAPAGSKVMPEGDQNPPKIRPRRLWGCRGWPGPLQGPPGRKNTLKRHKSISFATRG
jgi:hypothetical protein